METAWELAEVKAGYKRLKASVARLTNLKLRATERHKRQVAALRRELQEVRAALTAASAPRPATA